MGPVGLMGAVSAAGAMSPVGVTGAMSPVGVTGAMSPVGATGAMSPVGATGAMGAVGVAALAVLAAVAVAVGVVLWLPPRRRPAPATAAGSAGSAGGAGAAVGGTAPERDGLLRRYRWCWAVCAGLGAAVVLGGPLALPAGAVAGWATWVAAGRIESPAVRRRREEVRRDLPHVVGLLAAALRAGAAPAVAIDTVCQALPGAAADRLAPLAARLQLGADPVALWSGLADDPVLGGLGRTLARTHRTGAPVVEAVERLGVELATRGRAEVEDRARAVGVKAAVPLGICLLPSFLLLGIVPLVAGLAAALAW